MKLHIRHRTTYRYAGAVTYSIQTLRLTPRREPSQRSLSWQLHAPGRRVEQLDAFGNISHLLTLEGSHSQVSVHAEGVIETSPGFDGRIAPDGGLSPLAYLNATTLTTANAAIQQLARQIFAGAKGNQRTVLALQSAVAEVVRYQPGSTMVSDSASDVMERGQGVCQDQAHVAIALCRAAGVPARYVSGYILVEDGAHASSHAWLDVWLEDDKLWQSVDVTHQTPAGERLCRLAVGRDYMDAAPVRGVRRGGGREELDVSVSVSATAATEQ